MVVLDLCHGIDFVVLQSKASFLRIRELNFRFRACNAPDSKKQPPLCAGFGVDSRKILVLIYAPLPNYGAQADAKSVSLVNF